MKIGRKTPRKKDSNMTVNDGEKRNRLRLNPNDSFLESNMGTYVLETQDKNIIREDSSIQVT